jgi:hypothetical protein
MVKPFLGKVAVAQRPGRARCEKRNGMNWQDQPPGTRSAEEKAHDRSRKMPLKYKYLAEGKRVPAVTGASVRSVRRPSYQQLNPHKRPLDASNTVWRTTMPAGPCALISNVVLDSNSIPATSAAHAPRRQAGQPRLDRDTYNPSTVHQVALSSRRVSSSSQCSTLCVVLSQNFAPILASRLTPISVSQPQACGQTASGSSRRAAHARSDTRSMHLQHVLHTTRWCR